MSQDKQPDETPYPKRSLYGRFFRERGTKRAFMFVVAVLAVWYGYNYIHIYEIDQVKWPALKPDPSGITVLGLLDRNRPGWRRKYMAIESNEAWQIRRPDDAPPPDDTTPQEKQERGSVPAEASRVVSGDAVPVSELMRTLPVVLTSAQFKSAWVTEHQEPLFDRKYYALHIVFSDEGRSRYWQFSSKHDKERLVFVLGGRILTCPRMVPMDTSELTISPIPLKSDADELRNFINCHKVTNCR
jgi:hypothetical protein